MNFSTQRVLVIDFGLCNIDDKANLMVTLLFRIWYKCITENVQTNINNNANFIDWFNFPINHLFFQLSIRFKVDQIKKAINFSEITSLRLKIFTNVSITSNVNQCYPIRRDKSEYRNLELSWLSTVKFSRPCPWIF